MSPNLEHVLLIQKARPDWQAGFLNGIGGRIEPGETPQEAMGREAREETPYSFSDTAWLHYADMDKRGEWVVHVFYSLVDSLIGDQRLITEWNKPGRDEPLHIVLVASLPRAKLCIKNLPGLIGFIADYDPRRLPLEIRY